MKLNLYHSFRANDWISDVIRHILVALRSHNILVNEVIPTHTYDGINLKRIALFENAESGLFRCIEVGDLVGQSRFRSREIINHWKCEFVLKAQFRPNIARSYGSKLRPFCYWGKFPNRLDKQIEKSRLLERKVRRMHFRGSVHCNRGKILSQLKDCVNLNTSPVPFDKYLKELSEHALVLSLPGFGNCCHREIEAFALGTPVIMPVQKNAYADPLVPNIHYIAVECDTVKSWHEASIQIKKRFLEVCDDLTYLAGVSDAAAKWYDKNVRFPNSAQKCIELLGFV